MSRPLVIQVKEKDKAAAAATAPTVPQPKPVAGLKSSGGAKATPKPMTLTSETSEEVLAVKPAPKPLPPKPAAAPTGASSSSPSARPSVAGAGTKSPATEVNMARSQTSYAGSKAAAINAPSSSPSPLARQTTAGAALQNGHGAAAASPSAPSRPQPASAPDVRPQAPAPHAHTQSSPNVTAAAPAKSAMKSSGDVGAHKGSTGARVTVAALPEKTSASASASPHTSSYGGGAVSSRSSSKGSDGGAAPYGVGSSYAARRSMGLALNPAAAKATTALEFLQHQAAVTAWIEELTKAPLPNKDHTPAGFVAALADGVVLCRAMLAIDERSIPGINPTRTPMQIRDNLNNFLEACREIGVPDLNLFRLPDVLARANAVQVVECVYALALVCAKNSFKPALRDNTSASFPAAATREAEALHTRFGRKGATSLDALLEADAARLEGRPNAPEKEAPLPAVPSHSTAALPPTPTSKPASTATAAAPATNSGAARRRAGPPPPVVRADLLRLATPKTVKGITRLQAIARGRAARTLFLQRRRGLAYRDRVAQEILATEQSYVAGLQTLTRLYIEPLEAAIRDGKPILSKEDVKTIFGNIQVILGVNSVLLKDMEPRIKAWGPQQCLGDIFLNICKFLKVYTQFIRDYSVIMATIASSLKQNKKFETFCKGAEREAKGYSLDSFLILPVQRIPRYILLLNELKKHTWSDHRDYKAVVEAWTQVQEVANYVNQKKKESEDLSKVLEIESKIEGVLKRELVEAHRKFVTELEVKVLKDKKKADRTLLVFNDLILVTKHSGDKYKLVDEINLDPKWSNAVTTKDGKEPNSIALMNDMDVQLLAFLTEPPEKRTEVRDLLNRLRSDFEERARASDAQATKRAQQKAEDFKHLVEASVEADSNASSEQLNQISRGGSIKMHPRRQHPEHVQKLKDELKKITPDMTKDLLSEERSFVKIINLTLQESKKKGRARALFVCSDIALFVQPAKDQEKHPDEYKFLAQYQIMELSARDCSGPGDGSFAELVHGEGTSDTLGPFKFATEAERKSFVSDLASVRAALIKRGKEADAAKTAKAQTKAEGAKKAIGESYGKSKGDKAAKQMQEPKDGEGSEAAASATSATSNASEGGLRKWAQKKEEIKKAREASTKK